MRLSETNEFAKLANTLEEAASRTGFSIPYLRKQIAAKRLKVMRYGRAIRVLETDLLEFLQKGVGSEK